MNPDIDYALRQLRGIAGYSITSIESADRIKRAIDALERIKQAEIDSAINAEIPPLEPTKLPRDVRGDGIYPGN